MRVWDGCTGERGQKKFVAFYIIIDMGNFADFLPFLNCYSALEEELTTAYTMKNKPPVRQAGLVLASPLTWALFT